MSAPAFYAKKSRDYCQIQIIVLSLQRTKNDLMKRNIIEKKLCGIKWLALLVLPMLFACGGDDDEPEVVVPVARDYSVLTARTDNAMGVTWSEGDSLAVYTLASTSFYRYTLAGSPGSVTSTFNRQPSTVTFRDGADCYALTATQNIYSVSATESSHMKLSYKLPAEYDARQLSSESGSFLMNVPSWGFLTFDDNGRPSTTLKALTAFLSVDLSKVPEDTRSILVTTHNSIRLNDVDVAGGAGEPLAGTFDCILEDGAALTTGSLFRYNDVIQVVLNEYSYDKKWQALGRLFIPIVVGNYQKVQVVALSEQYYFDYDWHGTLLATFDAQKFALNSLYQI
jgi:hypothetical protein